MAIIHTGPMASQTIQGAELGASVSLILDHSAPGEGPRLHRHPYHDTWVVQAGSVRFQAGEKALSAGPGDVVAIPQHAAQVRQRRDRAVCACVHPRSPTMIGAWLE